MYIPQCFYSFNFVEKMEIKRLTLILNKVSDLLKKFCLMCTNYSLFTLNNKWPIVKRF